MTKTLYVGDPHATVEELPDCESLMLLVEKTATEQSCTDICILGDLHNNFAVTNVRVTAFWRRWLKQLSAHFRVIALVGNHDMPGDGQRTPHALIPYEDLVTVVDKPFYRADTKRLYLPYVADPNLFIDYVNEHPEAQAIVCHQEFNGAAYDNGFYSPHGVDPNLMHVPVISGHIHTAQQLGNVWYPGSPRWRTLSDAATKERYLFTVSDTGASSGHPTSLAVKKIWEINITPETAHIVHLYARKDEYRIRVEGPTDFIKEQMEKLSSLEAVNKRISTVATDSRVIRVRESDGVDVAFRKYTAAFKPMNGTPASALTEMASNRL